MFVGSGELRAPWSGTAPVARACTLMAVGLVAGLRGVLLAVAVATASLVGSDLADDGRIEMTAPTLANPDACDPSCGFGLGDALMLALPVVAGLAGVGAPLRGLARRRDLLRRRPAGGRGPRPRGRSAA
jgi:hypothetical protein